MTEIKVALIGVGNCSSALIQGLNFYRKCQRKEDYVGLRNPYLGKMSPKTIKIVSAFDVDERKVGKDLSEAIFAEPNNSPRIIDVPSTGVTVKKGSRLDGVGNLNKKKLPISGEPESDIAGVLKDAEAEMVLNLLPSGAVKASKWYAEQALAADCAFINATPNFIASDQEWAKRFEEAGLPLAGDDLVDQVGSTTLHKTLLQLLSRSGVKITETYQLDVGGSTESLETLNRTRETKRAIKTRSVASALPYKTDLVAGSTDYVDFLKNKRDSYFWISGTYFCNSPMQIDMKFSTIDAPNAGSVLFDVIRAMKLALQKEKKGAIIPICAYAFKHPPKMLPMETTDKMFSNFVNEASEKK